MGPDDDDAIPADPPQTAPTRSRSPGRRFTSWLARSLRELPTMLRHLEIGDGNDGDNGARLSRSSREQDDVGAPSLHSPRSGGRDDPNTPAWEYFGEAEAEHLYDEATADDVDATAVRLPSAETAVALPDGP